MPGTQQVINKRSRYYRAGESHTGHRDDLAQHQFSSNRKSSWTPRRFQVSSGLWITVLHLFSKRPKRQPSEIPEALLDHAFL